MLVPVSSLKSGSEYILGAGARKTVKQRWTYEPGSESILLTPALVSRVSSAIASVVGTPILALSTGVLQDGAILPGEPPGVTLGGTEDPDVSCLGPSVPWRDGFTITLIYPRGGYSLKRFQ